MKSLGTVSRLMIVVCMSLGTVAILQAQQGQQAGQTKPFQPQSGQAGKDVVWVPTATEMVNKMLDMAKVTPQDYVVDLGSGDGRIVIAAAKRGARALGIEYNPNMVALAKTNAAKEGVTDKATFMRGDLFQADFSKATVVTMFLLPSINLRLRPELLKMKPGTRIVSNTFDMGDWQADESATVDGGCTTWCTALLWIVPANASGSWQLSGGELALTQQFQMLSGTLTLNGKSTPVSHAKMLGDQIMFTAGETDYTGRLTGNAIAGTANTNGTKVPWSATRAEQ